MRFAAPGLVLLVLLAGCGGQGGGGAQIDPFRDLEIKPTATTGVIRGVVVDEAIRPIANATVELSPATPPVSTRSNADGAFGFQDLEPGTYFVKVSKAGFLGGQQSTDVVAGLADPPIVKLQLVPDAAYTPPFVESFVFDGFIECSGGVVTPVVYGILSACSAEQSGVKPFANDHFDVTYILSALPTFVQAEMVWDSTQAAGDVMQHAFAYPCPVDEAPDGLCDLQSDGTSPVINTMDEETAYEYVQGENKTLYMRVFPWADSTTNTVALAIEQRFTIYTTVFYGYLPPEGWALSSGSEVPAPPA